MKSDQKFPNYIGGGDLWEEPIREPEWWENEWLYPVLGAASWLLIATSFFFVGLSFWLM